MPLQNRVLPTGEIVASPMRGTFMGNRGILHKADRTLGAARWRHKAWITCLLQFKTRHSDVMPDGRYTRLFFYDEAVAYAAGHRPCAECRRAEFKAFQARWRDVMGPDHPRAAQMDAALHKARVESRSRWQVTYNHPINDLPNGCFIRLPDSSICYLIRNDALYPFASDGYGAPVKRPSTGTVQVLTPEPIVQIFRTGLQPQLHPGFRL